MPARGPTKQGGGRAAAVALTAKTVMDERGALTAKERSGRWMPSNDRPAVRGHGSGGVEIGAKTKAASHGPSREPVPEVTVVDTRDSPADDAPRGVAARAAEMSELEPFAIEVQRREHVAIVQPRGELDLATIETLRSRLDAAIAETLRAVLDDGMETTARVVLDLRGLSFIDSTGLHLLVALDQRAGREGFLLTLLAPAHPIGRSIQVCGLNHVLPFVAPDDAGPGANVGTASI